MFAPVIEIDNDLYDKLTTGEVMLRPGQWVRFEWCDRKSRWVGLSPAGVVWAQHYNMGYSKDSFQRMSDAFNKMIKG